jgi:hypothetical protein
MEFLDVFGTRAHTAPAIVPPAADNDNMQLMEAWMTPAEFLQWLRRTREEMRRELAADFSLRNCPKHRRHWDALSAMERCALWHYYGMR